MSALAVVLVSPAGAGGPILPGDHGADRTADLGGSAPRKGVGRRTEVKLPSRGADAASVVCAPPSRPPHRRNLHGGAVVVAPSITIESTIPDGVTIDEWRRRRYVPRSRRAAIVVALLYPLRVIEHAADRKAGRR